MTKNEVNIESIIQEDYVAPESEFDRKRTKTSHFMLNTVFPNSSLMATEFFVNAFLEDDEFKHSILRPLFLLFKVRQENKWTTIAQRLRAKNEYVLEYYCGKQDGKDLIMMVFQVPDRYAKEYLNFKAGKYSQFSDEYKKLFNRYTHNDRAQPVESTVWRVIHKSPELKRELEAYFEVPETRKIGKPVKFNDDDELWGIPEPKFEFYRFKLEK